MSDLPRAIVIDPPWKYANSATRNAAAKQYALMTIEELEGIRLEAGADAHLYLWTTVGFIEEAFGLMRAWGFTYKTLLTWQKPQMGMGNYFRVNSEHVLFGVRGKLPTLRKNCPTVFTAPRQRHSAKPDMFYDLVESMSPGPYREYFSRRPRLGWQCEGLESNGSDIKEVR